MKYGQTFGALYDEILSRLKADGIILSAENDVPYPDWWNKTITVYNKYIDDENRCVTWHRHVLQGCYFGTKETKSISGTEVQLSSSLIARVPYSFAYLPAHKWIATEKGEYFTFQTGDIIIGCECEATIDESTKGSRSDDLLSQYPGNAFMIKVFADNTGVELRHYKVEG